MSTTEERNKAQFRRTYEEMFNQGNLTIKASPPAPTRAASLVGCG